MSLVNFFHILKKQVAIITKYKILPHCPNEIQLYLNLLMTESRLISVNCQTEKDKNYASDSKMFTNKGYMILVRNCKGCFFERN